MAYNLNKEIKSAIKISLLLSVHLAQRMKLSRRVLGKEPSLVALSPTPTFFYMPTQEAGLSLYSEWQLSSPVLKWKNLVMFQTIFSHLVQRLSLH